MAGTTAISGASAERKTAMSSAITKAIEKYSTCPPVLPDVALLSTRVATDPAVCASSPAGNAAAEMTERTPATRLAC